MYTGKNIIKLTPSLSIRSYLLPPGQFFIFIFFYDVVQDECAQVLGWSPKWKINGTDSVLERKDIIYQWHIKQESVDVAEMLLKQMPVQ